MVRGFDTMYAYLEGIIGYPILLCKKETSFMVLVV